MEKLAAVKGKFIKRWIDRTAMMKLIRKGSKKRVSYQSKINEGRREKNKHLKSRHLKSKLLRKRLSIKRQGFLLMELLFIMTLFSIVMTISITRLDPRSFQEHVNDIAFMNELKGAIIRQRMQSAKELGIGFNFFLTGDGSITFVRNGKHQLVLDDPTYRVYIIKGQYAQINTQWSFNNRPLSGENGFTLKVYKAERLLSELKYQFNTHTFHEVFYE